MTPCGLSHSKATLLNSHYNLTKTYCLMLTIIELIFFVVLCMGLWFGFVTKQCWEHRGVLVIAEQCSYRLKYGEEKQKINAYAHFQCEVLGPYTEKMSPKSI